MVEKSAAEGGGDREILKGKRWSVTCAGLLYFPLPTDGDEPVCLHPALPFSASEQGAGLKTF